MKSQHFFATLLIALVTLCGGAHATTLPLRSTAHTKHQLRHGVLKQHHLPHARAQATKSKLTPLGSTKQFFHTQVPHAREYREPFLSRAFLPYAIVCTKKAHDYRFQNATPRPHYLLYSLLGATGGLAWTLYQQPVEAQGYRGKYGYEPYDCRYGEEFARHVQKVLADVQKFKERYCSGNYIAYKNKKIQEWKEIVREQCQTFDQEEQQKFASIEAQEGQRAKEFLFSRKKLIRHYRKSVVYTRCLDYLTAKLEEASDEVEVSIDDLSPLATRCWTLSRYCVYEFCAKVAHRRLTKHQRELASFVDRVSQYWQEKSGRLQRSATQEELDTQQAVAAFLNGLNDFATNAHTATPEERSAMFKALKSLLDQEKEEIKQEKALRYAQSKAKSEAYHQALNEWKQGMEAELTQSQFQALLQQAGGIVLVNLLWAQDQADYLLTKHFFKYSCWLFRGSACHFYNANKALRNQYYDQLEQEIKLLRDMIGVPHPLGWEERIPHFLAGGAEAAVLLATGEALMLIPGLQPIALGVAFFKGAFDFAVSLREQKYCPEKEELRIQQELHVRAFAADKDSINKARAWGSWAFSTLTLLDGLSAWLKNAEQTAVTSAGKKAVQKAEQAALNVAKQHALKSTEKNLLANAEQKALEIVKQEVLKRAQKEAVNEAGRKAKQHIVKNLESKVAGAGRGAGGAIKRSSQSAGAAGGARGGGGKGPFDTEDKFFIKGSRRMKIREKAESQREKIVSRCGDLTDEFDEIVQQSAGPVLQGADTHTIKPATAEALGLSKCEAGNALEDLKKKCDLLPEYHGNIMESGDYVDPHTGKLHGNIFHYVKKSSKSRK